MSRDQRRRQIAWEAARLLCHQQESQGVRARWRAALRICGGAVSPSDLPSQREIHGQFMRLERSLREIGLPRAAEATRAAGSEGDRFLHYETLLVPLEQVHEGRRRHPEGDVLYHSLQVFELGRQELPYDEEFLLAALLHDVGKAIDPKEHVEAGLEALDGSITPRTAWLIAHHQEALTLREGKLGVRSRRRLEASEDFENLLLLADCDRKGRQKGFAAPDVVDAIGYLRSLANTNGE